MPPDCRVFLWGYEMDTKVCGNCRKELEKNTENFYMNGKYFSYICKECTKQRSKKWAKDNPEKHNERSKKWVKDNPEKRKIIANKYAKKYREKNKHNPEYRILKSLRDRLYIAVAREYKTSSCTELLGCSIADLKMRLSTMFKPGMSWDNYGEWHIDHITPCASFDLTDPAQQRECFHFSNLQPLWAEDNRSKGAKILECV